MKKTFLLSFLSFITVTFSIAQNVAINATGSLPDSSAMLDVSSVTKGFLPPRMTMAQRDLIARPATGIIVYQTDGTTGLYCNKGTPAVPDWQLIGPIAPLSYGYFSGLAAQDGYGFQQNMFLFTTHAADGITLLNNNSAVVSKTGLYRIAYQLNMQSGNGSIAYVNIAVNGVNTSTRDSRQTAGSSSITASMSDERIMMLNAGDAISITFTGTSITVRCFNRSLFITQMR